MKGKTIMIRKVKQYSVLAVIGLAIAALSASTAEAFFKVGKTPNKETFAELHGKDYGTESENAFVAGGQKIGCSGEYSELTGTLNGSSESLTMNAKYVHCHTLVEGSGLPATVTMNGCDFVFDNPSQVSETEFTGTVDLQCPAGKKVVFDVYLFGSMTSHSVSVCTYEVGSFSNVGDVVYTNIPGGESKVDDITLKGEVGKVGYSKKGSCGTGEGSDGSFFLKKTLTSAKDADDLWLVKG